MVTGSTGLSLLVNCMFVQMERRTRGSQSRYFNKETSFFFFLIWQGREGKEEILTSFYLFHGIVKRK